VLDNALIEQSGEEEEAYETPTSSLTTYILTFLLPLLLSKEKTTRYRSTQLISFIINSVESIDDDLFQQLRTGLLKRIRDKESTVRVQAVLGLGRLAGNEADVQDDEDDEDHGAVVLLEKLLEVLQNDPSADVRRSLLLNLPLTPETLPYLLERARDLDPPTRRALYSRLLPALGDFRHLSLSMREKLLRWGLRDRDENVRKAAAKLFRERWIEDCAGGRSHNEDGVEQVKTPSLEGLQELLERIDVVNSGVENGVAIDAMKGFWEGRSDYREAMEFSDAFWDSLSAESAFLVRSFNDFCRQGDGNQFEDLIEGKMPEVTKLGFFLQKYINQLISKMRVSAEEGEEDEDTVELEFIVEQLLHVAKTLDYSDEVGRRKIFSLLRESLSTADLPEESTALVVEVLRGLCGSDTAGEREFCGVVLEAIAEVHDTIMGEDVPKVDDEDSFHSAKSELSDDTATNSKKSPEEQQEIDEEKAIREIMVNMKCLHIAQCMLENVEGNLKENVDLVTMLNNLVVPAVRSHEAPVRERGLRCLGLCSLLDKGLAEENLTLFLHCFNKGHDALQISALHIISDILTVHSTSFLATESCPVTSAQLFKMYTKAMKADDKLEVQAAACESLCKLMLGLVVKDEDLLKALVVAYFDPGTTENLGLRQSLTYFLPVYCHSRAENQARMQSIAVNAIHTLILLHDNLDEEEEMVSPSIIASHIADWTDPRKVVGGPAMESMFDENGKKIDLERTVDCTVHLDIALEVLEKIQGSCSSKSPLTWTSSGSLYNYTNIGSHRRREENPLHNASQALYI
jgi:condensin complex subunit 3